MFERVIAVISIISQYLIEDIDVFDQEMEIVDDLMALGFETSEIEAAFSWIANLSQGIKRGDEALDAEYLGQYVRIFTAEEKRLLTNPARGYLMKLHNLELVNAPLMEEIIDQAILLDTPAVGVEEIKMISTMVVMFSQSAADAKSRFLQFIEADAEVIYH